MALTNNNQAYSPEEIKQLHIEGTAVPGREYKLLDGSEVFVGTEEGRIRLADPVKGDVGGNLNDTEIERIGNYTTIEFNELMEFLDGDVPPRSEMDRKLSENECRQIAYAIALG